MTEIDIQNLERIEKIVKDGMGYSKESFEYFKRELYNPFIDEEFKKILGDDLRKRYKIELNDETILKQFSLEDKAYKYFKSFFYSALSNYSISYNDFLKNRTLIEKNEVKLQKFFNIFYKKNPLSFSIDYTSNVGRNINIDMITDEMISSYISSSFETIGRYKSSAGDLELVVSCNFADIFLCSAGQSWTSCFDIEKGAYWYGVPGLIGDKSRAFVYITNGKSKEVLGIKTDNFLYRSWILLDENNNKNLVKFYPTSNIGEKLIQEITNDKSYHLYKSYVSASCCSKHPVELIFFDKGLASTVSNDISKICLFKNKYHHNINGTGGIQHFSRDKNNIIKEIGSLSLPQPSLPDLLSKKITFSSCLKSYNCKCGNAPTKIMENGEKVCDECFKKDFFLCGKCRKTLEIKNKNILDGVNLCPSCFNQEKKVDCSYCHTKIKMADMYNEEICKNCHTKLFFKCHICYLTKKREDSRTIKTTTGNITVCRECFEKKTKKCIECQNDFYELNEMGLCRDCATEHCVKCLGCNKIVYKKTLTAIHTIAKDKKLLIRRCPFCFNPKEYIFKECCNSYWIKERLNEDGSCPLCNKEKNS